MIELPPQQWICVAPTPDGRLISLASEESVEARERILLARIAELEADAERLDSGRIMFTTRDVYGEPARVTFAGVDLRAAIDAARGAK